MSNKTPLQRLKAATEAASPGPWTYTEEGNIQDKNRRELLLEGPVGGCIDARNAEFIVLARQLVPLLMEGCCLGCCLGYRSTMAD